MAREVPGTTESLPMSLTQFLTTLIHGEHDYENVLWITTDQLRTDPWPSSIKDGKFFSHVFKCAHIHPNHPMIPDIQKAIEPTWLNTAEGVRDRHLLPHLLLDIARHQGHSWQIILEDILANKNLHSSQSFYKQRIIEEASIHNQQAKENWVQTPTSTQETCEVEAHEGDG